MCIAEDLAADVAVHWSLIAYVRAKADVARLATHPMHEREQERGQRWSGRVLDTKLNAAQATGDLNRTSAQRLTDRNAATDGDGLSPALSRRGARATREQDERNSAKCDAKSDLHHEHYVR
jgi:hypothetical protein